MAAKRASQEPQRSLKPGGRPHHVLDVDVAAGEVRQVCEGLGNAVQRSPFFFVVGAGISSPPVPLAADIIDHCREVAQSYNRKDEPAASATLDLYSHWFSRAFPNARQRHDYLRSLIERKPLSLASLRLAHLLSVRKLTNLVVTTNFDDFIARALRLFGEEPVVCDHPRTVGRIDPERNDIQIVHVHGSYVFYDCVNLRGEVAERARLDQETSLTMVGLLDSILWNRSPIVIGYSGWEGDVVMSALHRRLLGGHPLAQSIYWFCYRRGDPDRLPDWLRESADVRFVLPAEPAGTPVEGRGEGAYGRSRKREKGSQEPTLRAREVLDKLNQVFEVGMPPLFENPASYYAQSLEASLPPDEVAEVDPYGFKVIVQQLKDAATSIAQAKKARGVEADLEKLRTEVRRSGYREAIKILDRIVPTHLGDLNPAERREVVHAADLAGPAVLKKGNYLDIAGPLASALSLDAKLEAALGTLPAGMVWVVGSRFGQESMENFIDGKTYCGAFSYNFTTALNSPKADHDGDGLVSVHEAAIQAGVQLLKADIPQSPVVAGDGHSLALFRTSGRASPGRARGRVVAVMAGVVHYKYKQRVLSPLLGPTNDLARFSLLLRKGRGATFSTATVKEYRDRQATHAQLKHALAAAADSCREQDVLLFYFSGRGSKDELEDGSLQLSIYFHDFVGLMTHRDLLELMGPARARHKLVILDF